MESIDWHRALYRLAQATSSPSRLRREFIEAGRQDLLSNAVLRRCRTRGKFFNGFPELCSLVDAWATFAFEADRDKANDLTALGYRVLRATWRMLTKEPDRLETTLRAMMGRN